MEKKAEVKRKGKESSMAKVRKWKKKTLRL